MRKIHPITLAHIIVDIVFILLIVTWLINAGRSANAVEHEDLYAEGGTVVSVDEMNHRTVFYDSKHRELYVYSIGDWGVGDDVLLIVDGHGTEYIYDDEIVSVSPAS